MINPILLLSLIASAVTLLIGIITSKWYPKKINSAIGYRTRRSMASQAAWNFAQEYSAKISLKSSPIAACIGIMAIFIPRMYWAIELSIALILFIIFLFSVVFITEKRLREVFDDNGNIKS